MAPHFVLFEHAAGYGLFRLQEFEEIATFLPQVEESVTDVSKFSQVVNLIGFFPFKTAGDALANINSVSEGIVHDDLKLFLETNMPKGGKGAVLGVSDSKLSASINDACGIKCSHIGVIPEVIRGIRQHFAKLVKGFSTLSSDKSQLGLSHSYSRCKVKFNVNKSDNMIIQSIALLDQLDKDINTFCMRIREWYSYHFPELIKIVPENALYAKVVKLIKNRKELTQDMCEQIEEIVMDSAKAQAVIDASKSSMGMDISPVDLLNIDMFASRVIGLADYRKELSAYLRNKMALVAPNLATLIGDTVGARLISHAGSLTNLAKAPASTVQILGAEKALFRALKTKGNTPKYGLIFHSSFIGRAGAKNKGRISRYLANKCSIASRIDAFSDEATTVFGSKLKEQVEDRLKFYETGDLPRKNVDVMAEAVEEAADEIKKRKKKDKKKKRKADDGDVADTTADVSAMDTTAAGDTTVEDEPAEPPKKKKKKKKDADVEAEAEVTADTTAEIATEITEIPEEKSAKKKKKKDKNKEESVETNGDVSLEEAVPIVLNGSEKKKKKKKKVEED
eukprot:GFUD01036017.1.p1 GENE.GFUD01036017.1~~GFUD01036017.1.p1  ORF type:complete len:565 (+),score=182.55 GFUD01036017.1:74-1768(+)